MMSVASLPRSITLSICEESALNDQLQQPTQQPAAPAAQAKLKQIQSVYDPLQDRLLVRFSTTDNAEFPLWFTRRFVQLIWKPMVQILASGIAAEATLSPQAQQATLGFEHQAALSKANFSSKYEESAERWPLGKSPLLVVTLEIKKTSEDHFTFSFRPREGLALNVVMQRDTIHSLCKLLIEASEKGDWQLGLRLVSHPQSIPMHTSPTLQ